MKKDIVTVPMPKDNQSSDEERLIRFHNKIMANAFPPLLPSRDPLFISFDTGIADRITKMGREEMKRMLEIMGNNEIK